MLVDRLNNIFQEIKKKIDEKGIGYLDMVESFLKIDNKKIIHLCLYDKDDKYQSDFLLLVPGNEKIYSLVQQYNEMFHEEADDDCSEYGWFDYIIYKLEKNHNILDITYKFDSEYFEF